MTCEEFLMQYRDAMLQITEINDQIAELEATQGRLVASYEVEKVRGRRENDGPVPAQDLDELTEMRARRDQMLLEAEAKRLKILELIGQVGTLGGPDEVIIRQYRKLLKQYYCDLLSWTEVARQQRATNQRRGRTVINVTRAPGVTERTMFDRRLVALGLAERAYRKLYKG